ncbi:helix-turn-helix domain-containing protein [Amylibacter sp. SFDW26]|uniref:AraC family transcriptional regulator n=1 Tax=Amylibacter sp. SFDW26 TaxID=2652722 RepID=UPI001261FFA3|nr:AraC family transcriptional regulator [Amylibacter sp. SFDW26]KAB7615875.1 helix-turn-helix domain-containing protein [Amylibacter sp. SFDW26]
MTHSHLMQSKQTVFVSALAPSIRNFLPELRMDGQNGMHKILWISKGNARIMIDGVTKGVGPNTFIYVPCNIPHVFEVGSNTYGSFISIYPNSNLNMPRHSFVFPVLNIMKQSEVTKYIDSIVSEATSDTEGRFPAMESYVNLLIVHILRLTGDQIEKVKENASQKLMRRFSRILERQYNTGRSLSEYAEALGVTTTHLSRVSRALNHKSAGQIIQDRVLSEAMQLLLHSNLKVQDISKSLGFSSPAYFTRLFNSKLNQTPKDYRKSRARGPEETQRIRARGL